MRTLRHRRSAIASLVKPAATSSRTSSSRGLSATGSCRPTPARCRGTPGARTRTYCQPARRRAGCDSPTPAGRTAAPGCAPRAAGPLDRYGAVPACVRDQGRRRHARRDVDDVDRACAPRTAPRDLAEVERRCSSSYHAICSAVPCGRNSMLNRWRKVGLVSVQPARIADPIASACARASSPRHMPAPRVAPVKDEAADPLGMPRRVDERDRAPWETPSSVKRSTPAARRRSRGRRPRFRRRVADSRSDSPHHARRSGRACGVASSASQ